MAVQRKSKTHMRSNKMISKKKSSLKKKYQKGGSPASNLVNDIVYILRYFSYCYWNS